MYSEVAQEIDSVHSVQFLCVSGCSVSEEIQIKDEKARVLRK